MRSLVRSSSGSRDGVALVLVLAFIVLTSILVISFIAFSSSNHISTSSYAKAIQAQEIAQGGLQDILNDLHQEIVAGSIPDPTGSTFTQGSPTTTTIYFPSTNLTAQPARIGYAASSYSTDISTTQFGPSLVRVSRAIGNGGDTFFSALPSYYSNISAVPGGKILDRASVASTAAVSANGRSISTKRWNKSFLLASTAANVPSPFTTTPPDWVYVTRTGSRTCITAELPTLKPSNNLAQNYVASAPGTAPPASPVIGRYAFIIYDEGALLDANVAGSPSTLLNATVPVTSPSLPVYTNSVTGVSLALTGKSYLAFSDLTQLPGLVVASAQTKVDNFISWRNGSAVTSSGTTVSGTNYLQAVAAYAQNNYLAYTNSATGGDNPLVDRQDLINYFSSIDPNMNTTSASASKALPYLGTFSRAVSAPTYKPPLNSSSMTNYISSMGTAVNYASNAENTGIANRDLANVRFASAGTVTHYVDDQTAAAPTATYTVKVGDQLLQSRFSLARINWLSSHVIGGADPGQGANPNTGSAPSAQFATAIQACFGLVWGVQGVANGGNACWTYVGSSGGSTPLGAIKTLDQVAGESTPREPNFFELLKASILSGSLGMNTGACGWVNGTGSPFAWRDFYNYTIGADGLDSYSFDRTVAGAIPAPSRISDMQIMKIGADIIDQYDADSYPTAIYFNYTGMTSAFDAATAGTAGADHMLFGESNMVYGDENLPYITSIYAIAGTIKGTDTSGLNGWYQPQLWNPHQMPSSFPAAAPIPINYQIRAYGQGDVYWAKESEPTATEATTGTTAIAAPGFLDGSYINVSYSNSTGYQTLYPHPLALTTTLSGITCSASGLNSSVMAADPDMTSYSMNPFVAFWLGNDSTYVVDPDNNGSTSSPYKTQIWTETTGNTYALGWLDANSSFHPYSFMINPVGFSYGVIGAEKSPVVGTVNTGSAWPPYTGNDCHFCVDPRTTRFSTYGDWGSKMLNTTLHPNVGEPWWGVGGMTSDTTGWGRPSSSQFSWDPLNNSYYEIDWQANNPQASPTMQGGFPMTATPTYYADNDGVVRPGDGYYGTPSTGDGVALFTGSTVYPGYGTFNGYGTPSGSPIAAGDSGSSDLTANVSHGRRPVILNRPFRSVGELGYVYRDLPFKSLDFFSASSADAALLDVFSLTDEGKVSSSTINPVVAGEFNPSNAPLPVLMAVLSSGSKKDFDPTYNMGIEAETIATDLAGYLNPTSGPNPLLNRAALVTQLGSVLRNGFSSSGDIANKAYMEAPVRALADVTNTRTWNLMIDIIAQSGHMSPTAATLNDFVVDGEKRYWLHVAIDRYTGKIVDQQLEPVYE